MDCAASAVSVDKRSISRACLNVNQLYKGYYWSYDLTEPFVLNNDKRQKKVFQMDMTGAIIAEYVSVAKASRHTGINKSSIAKVCRGDLAKTAGFYWAYQI